MVGDEEKDDRRPQPRPSLKPHVSFNNYAKWKDKLRENCYKRVRQDRTRLIWKMRLPEPKNQSLNHKEFMQSTFQDIVTDELRKIRESSLNNYYGILPSDPETDDTIWEYDGLHTAYQGECEEILLEMQKIFYEDLEMEEKVRKEPESYIKTWEDEEDEYLARAVCKHMQLDDEKVKEEIWCPICKQGELQENRSAIYCTLCDLRLNGGDEVSLDLLRTHLAEAHTDHLERGCRLQPKFRIESKFDLTALYIECQVCNTFEIVI